MKKNKCIIKKVLVLFGVLTTMLFVSDLYAQQSFTISDYKYSVLKSVCTGEREVYVVDTFTFEKIDDKQANIKFTIFIINEQRKVNENFDVVVVGYDTSKIEFSDLFNNNGGLYLYQNEPKQYQLDSKRKTYDFDTPRVKSIVRIEKNSKGNLCINLTISPINQSARDLVVSMLQSIKIEMSMTDTRFHLL